MYIYNNKETKFYKNLFYIINKNHYIIYYILYNI